MSSIAVIGTGYVGLTTGACFAHLGHDVVCADIDASKVDLLNSGGIPILEPGLDEIVRESVAAGRLSFVLGAEHAATTAEFAYLCVPTPQGEDDRADLSYIEAAAREIAPVLPANAIVVNKSTVPVGSTHVVERAMNRPDITVVSNPEFLREGSAVHDFMNPDRIVIGADDRSAAVRVSSLFIGVTAPLIVTDPASAETIKYAANSFLATKISFVNAIAAVCEAVGADVNDVVLGMGSDPRIGAQFLKPGPGWGGSCFPKDTRAMVRIAQDAGYDFGLLEGVIQVNDEQFDRIVEKIARQAGGSLEGAQLCMLGLTFKANTDDLRDSPALSVARRLIDKGATVRAYDPAVHVPPLTEIEMAESAYAAAEGADVIALLTEWDEFRWLDWEKMAGAMTTPRIVDTRNLLDGAALRRKGFVYEGLGRS